MQNTYSVNENSEKRLVPPFDNHCLLFLFLAETVQFSFEGTKSVTMPDGQSVGRGMI
jgi:hypothetical protein